MLGYMSYIIRRKQKRKTCVLGYRLALVISLIRLHTMNETKIVTLSNKKTQIKGKSNKNRKIMPIRTKVEQSQNKEMSNAQTKKCKRR